MTSGRNPAATPMLLLVAVWIAASATAAHALQQDSPSPPPAASEPAVNPGWRWRLTGTLIGASHPVAIFATVGETRSLVLGDQIDGWTVTGVMPGEVTLSDGDNTRIFTLEGFSTAEAAERARQRSAEAARRDAKVRLDLARQEQEISASQDTLLAATKQMQSDGRSN